MSTLIVYYSLEGNTDYAAKRIAEQIGADLLCLRPIKVYATKGLAKFLHGGKSALTGETPELEAYEVNLSAYDRVILGFPVWASNPAPPIRTFLTEHGAELREKELAAFACQSGKGAEKALAKLKTLIGIDAFAAEAVFIDPKKKQTAQTDQAIDGFCRRLQ